MNRYCTARPTGGIRYPRMTTNQDQRPSSGGEGVESTAPEEPQTYPMARFIPLSLAFRASASLDAGEPVAHTWAPRLQLTVQNHEHTHVDNRQSSSRFRTVRNSYSTGQWKPISRVHRNGSLGVDDHETRRSFRRSRSVEMWDINRVDRVYRSPRVDSATSAVVAPGRSSPPKTAAPSPTVDMNKLDNELWNRFEKRIRIDRERRGKG